MLLTDVRGALLIGALVRIKDRDVAQKILYNLYDPTGSPIISRIEALERVLYDSEDEQDFVKATRALMHKYADSIQNEYTPTEILAAVVGGARNDDTLNAIGEAVVINLQSCIEGLLGLPKEERKFIVALFTPPMPTLQQLHETYRTLSDDAKLVLYGLALIGFHLCTLIRFNKERTGAA